MTISTTGPLCARPVTLERTLARVQGIAGALFAVFLLLHLSNILLAPLGQEVFNGYQRAIRQFYQFPPVELAVVIGPLLVHAAAGVWLALLRRGRPTPRSWRVRLHRWAGVFLLVFIAGHVLATRGASFFYGVFPEFEGLAVSIDLVPAYFYPYYFLLGVGGFYHASNGLLVLARRYGIVLSRNAQTAATVIVAAGVATSLLALGGVLFEIEGHLDGDYAKLSESLTGFSAG